MCITKKINYNRYIQHYHCGIASHRVRCSAYFLVKRHDICGMYDTIPTSRRICVHLSVVALHRHMYIREHKQIST